MKKIVFIALPTTEKLKKEVFTVNGDVSMKNGSEIYFTITPALFTDMYEGDEFNIYLIPTNGKEDGVDKATSLFIEEINRYNNKNNNVKFVIESLKNSFDVLAFEKTYKEMIRKFEDGAEVYVDLTYGSKALSLLILNVVSFGKKYFKMDIGGIFQGIHDVGKDKKDIYDLTRLYCLNGLIMESDYENSEKAIEGFDVRFSPVPF